MSKQFSFKDIMGVFSGKEINKGIQEKVKVASPDVHSGLAVKEELAGELKSENQLERKETYKEDFDLNSQQQRKVEDLLNKE